MRKRLIHKMMRAVIWGLSLAFLAGTIFVSLFYVGQVKFRMQTILFTMPENWQQTQEYIDQYAQMLQSYGDSMRLSVMNLQGDVLADSDAQAEQLENHLQRQEVQGAILHGFGSDLRKSSTLNEFQLYAAMRQGDYILRIAVGFSQLLQVILLIGLVAFFCMAICSASIYYWAEKITDEVLRPIDSLTKAAHAITCGNLDVHVDVGAHELGILGEAFNAMSRSVKQAVQALDQNRMQLAAVLQAMDDGVVVVDKSNKIVLANGRAGTLLGQETLAVGGKLEGLRSLLDVRDIIAQASEQSLHKPMQVYCASAQTAFDLMVFCKLLPNCDVLCVLTDITRLKKLETMRSEFVANVSHELKTPLTSIRGYIELLQNGKRDEQTARRFYEIIDIEADRLQNMINDLLTLSEIENGHSAPSAQRFDAIQVLNATIAMLKPLAQKADVRIETSAPDTLMMLGSEHRLQQLLINLLDNAVKYNKPNGLVKITLRQEKGCIWIEVRDTGIGIEKKHHERLFERFYRVDKSRSRENGGTGLGLSIVKHLVALYGGDIRIQSEVNQGTTFFVRLQQNQTILPTK